MLVFMSDEQAANLGQRIRPFRQAKASPETLKRLKQHLGVLSTVALKHLDQSLPWYRGLRPEERAALGLVAQKGIASFVSWYERPTTSPQWVINDVFGAAPTELTRSISLQKALQLIRTIVEVVESQVPDIAPEAEHTQLREAVLRYSREVAFAAADVYARAAETRGAWDSTARGPGRRRGDARRKPGLAALPHCRGGVEVQREHHDHDRRHAGLLAGGFCQRAAPGRGPLFAGFAGRRARRTGDPDAWRRRTPTVPGWTGWPPSSARATWSTARWRPP